MKLLNLSFIFIILFLISCKEKEPTAPEEETPRVEAIAEAVIGPEGGTLETDNFKLSIPEGAFTEAIDLKLFAEPVEEDLSEISVSEMFSVEGIPKDFQKSLKINLKYSGTLSGINFIAVGRRDTVQLLDTNFADVTYDIYEAVESDGFLSCEIDQFKNNRLDKKNSDDPDDLWITGFTKGKNEPAGDHFTIKGSYPVTYEEKVNKIVEYFENAYQRFREADFDYGGIDKRIELEFILISKEKEYVKVNNSYPLIPKINISINKLEITNSLRSYIVGGFLGLVLKRSENKHFANNDYNLLPFITWAVYQDNASKYKDRESVEILLQSGYYSHTYWYRQSAYLIEYIADKYGGDNKIAQISKKDKPLPFAIVDVMGNPKDNNWLNKFYEYLIIDDRYAEYSHSFYIGDISAKSDFIDDNSSELSHTLSYNNQSPKLFHFTANLTINENTKLKFKTNNLESGISLIKYKSGEKREVIKSSYGEVTITGIKHIVEDGFNLFALVTNNEYDPPNGNTNITLTIKKTEELVINGCSIYLRNLTGDFERIYTDELKESLPNESLSAGFPKDDPNAQVTFSNNTITQQYTNYKPSEDQSYSAKIVIVLSDENNDGEYDYVSSFSADWEYTYKSSTTYKNSMSAITIPRDKSVPFLKFKLTGTDVCSKIQSLSTSEIRSSFTYSFVEGTHKCDSDSEIEVFISAQ